MTAMNPSELDPLYLKMPCSWPGCTEEILATFAVCRKHWLKVPKAITERALMRNGQHSSAVIMAWLLGDGATQS